MLNLFITKISPKKTVALDIVGYLFFLSIITFGLLIVNLFATKEPFTSVEHFVYYSSLTMSFVTAFIGFLLMKEADKNNLK